MLRKLAVPIVLASSLLTVGTPVSADNSEPALALTHNDTGLKWGPCPDFLPKGCGIAVLHGDPSKPNVDVFLKVPGGSVIPSHTHTSAERMVLVSGQLDVTYENQSTATLKVGSYAYGPASRAHHAVCAQGEACVLFIAFEAPLDAAPTHRSTQQ